MATVKSILVACFILSIASCNNNGTKNDKDSAAISDTAAVSYDSSFQVAAQSFADIQVLRYEAPAQYNVRRQELALTAQVTSALVTLQAARRTVELQERNAATAREALQLAEERYRVGANTFVDLSTARAEFERAETDRIDMIYEFHLAFAALEAAVGRTLR